MKKNYDNFGNIENAYLTWGVFKTFLRFKHNCVKTMHYGSGNGNRHFGCSKK